MTGPRYTREVINPGGGAVQVDDVDAYIAARRAEGFEPYVDLGGGMQVPLVEINESATGDM
jgi:hypothetical protein